MNVTEKTKEVLKSFSAINSSFLIRKGNKQSTVSADDTVFAEAVIPDEFSAEMGVYDLPQFLGNLSLLNSPKLEFEGSVVNMVDADGFTITYRGCDKTLLHYPEAEMGDAISIDKPDVSFNLGLADLQKLLKVASTNTFTHLIIFAKDGKLAIKVADINNDTSNTGVMTLDVDVSDMNFECVFKVENLKILPMNYSVKIKKDGFAIFENSDQTLKYIISLEAQRKKGK